ncbi:NUDIX domain-containing protein [Falsirhodobacter algicola]|uniref:ADP-ribose pyrophosphatase n=1 Tax=Falsirhodobacter algicola TaxID=2692330 RepID=A0A8J8SKU8_9RHOB|nr:NUDIX domain-containing protein [Falsirhodobacter algicola]QUS35831.1 NUDIX domain-containing protein [Falsirhodobacter algicola]
MSDLPEGLRPIVLGDDPAQEEARLAFYKAAAAPVADDAAGRILARDVMGLMGQHPPEAIRKRLVQLRMSAGSRARAAASPPPKGLVHHAEPGDVQEVRRIQPYAHYFAVEEYDIRYRRFDGTMSEVVNRGVFISGDAVTVLPYDPVRDRVLVVEQWRAGPWGRGDPQPWLLEPVAGRIDPGEPPEVTGRREAVEEAGLEIGDLHLASAFYPSPGAKAEFVYAYVGIADLGDDAAGVFGLDGEAEDIRGHLLPFERLMEMVTSGEVRSAPLLITAYWLARERGRLRGE